MEKHKHDYTAQRHHEKQNRGGPGSPQRAVRLPASPDPSNGCLTQQGNLAVARTSGGRGPSLHSITLCFSFFLRDTHYYKFFCQMSWKSDRCLSGAGLDFLICNLKAVCSPFANTVKPKGQKQHHILPLARKLGFL